MNRKKILLQIRTWYSEILSREPVFKGLSCFVNLVQSGLLGNEHYKDQYWNDLDLVQQYINQNATGDRNTRWQVDIITRFKQYLPFKEVLIIGCGNGWVERQLYDLGIGLHFDAFDISKKYLEEAKRQRENRSINYFRADINHLENLQESKYDAVFNVGVLHHTFRISYAVWKISQVLRPNGLMFNFDYVGPVKNQYTNEHVKIMDQVNSQLPILFRSTQWLRPSRINFYFNPTEAVHSDLIRPVFAKYFDIIYERELNGGIAYQILWNNISEFKKNDKEAIETLEWLLKKDAEYTLSKKIPTLFWYAVGRPKLD